MGNQVWSNPHSDWRCGDCTDAATSGAHQVSNGGLCEQQLQAQAALRLALAVNGVEAAAKAVLACHPKRIASNRDERTLTVFGCDGDVLEIFALTDHQAAELLE